MKKTFFFWLLFRMILTGLVALWGFYITFTDGFEKGGKTLLSIASISFFVNFIYYFLYVFHKKKVTPQEN